MEDVLDETLTSQRFSALLLGLFAVVALALASVGIYSVLSYIVRGRSREIGIRTALGARTGDVVRLVVLEGMTPARHRHRRRRGRGARRRRELLEKLVFGVSAVGSADARGGRRHAGGRGADGEPGAGLSRVATGSAEGVARELAGIRE